MKLNLRSIIMLVFWISIPIYVHAHVKWFADIDPVKEPLEKILSPAFMSIALLIAVLLAALTQLLPVMMKVRAFKQVEDYLAGLRKWSRYLLKYGTVFALVIQIISGSILAPEFKLTTTSEVIWVWATIIVLAIPYHVATKIAALSILGLYLYVLSDVGLFHMLDYGFYIAIVGVLLIGKTKIENWGFPFLYLGTGLSLCWVAVEKWVYPTMTLDIIQQHHVPTFGFPAEIFIVLAAFIEFVVGYLLVVGILNRVLAVVVTILFFLTTTIFGYTEIVGHAMIHVILIIFIIEGVSFYDPPISIHKTRVDQMVFVFLNFIFTLATFILIYYRFA